MLIDIAARSNRVYSSMGLTQLYRSTPPHHPAPTTLSVGNRVTVTLYRGTGPISAIAGSGRHQSVRPRDPTTTVLVVGYCSAIICGSKY